MECQVTREQLWSWIDRDAPELAEHLAACPLCRFRSEEIRREIDAIAADAEALHLSLPETIGPYRVLRLLGEGGQALVYEAEQASPRRPVAVKVLKGGAFTGPRDLRHFQREIQALAALRHPGIATIYEAGQTADGHHFYSMELAPGVPLHVFARENRPAPGSLLEIVLRIGEAVHYAHEHGVVHHDLKPSNVIVDAGGQPKVLDFGLARLARPLEGSTLSVAALPEGTPRYMSPERIRGEAAPLDRRSDVYSLGVMLFELLTGRAPHDVDSFTPEAIRTVCEEPAPQPSSLVPGLNAGTDAVLARALEKDPARRYPTVAEFMEDVARLRRGEPVAAGPPAARPRLRKLFRPQVVRSAARHPLVRAGVALLVLAAIALALRHRAAEEARIQSSALQLHCLLMETPIPAVRVAHLTQLLSPHRHHTEVALSLAQAEARTREYRFAVDVLREELRGGGPRWPLLLQLEEVYAYLGRPEVEEVRRELAGLRPPDDAAGHYLRAMATLDLDRSYREARRAVELEGRHTLALQAAAALGAIREDFSAAAGYAARVAELIPQSHGWRQLQGDYLLRAARYEEALATYDRCRGRITADSDFHYRRSRVLRKLGRLAEAVEALTRSIDSAPSEGSTAWKYFHRGTVLWMLGREDEAESDYRRCASLLGVASFGDARLAIILRGQGRPAEADSLLAEARRRAADTPWLAAILLTLAGGQTPEALIEASAGRSAPRRCEAWYYAGEVALAQGRTGQARDWFRACLETGAAFDPAAPFEPMSEFELAGWRLARLGS